MLLLDGSVCQGPAMIIIFKIRKSHRFLCCILHRKLARVSSKLQTSIWWTFLQSARQLHTPSKPVTSVALCCVIKLHMLEWSFIVASLRHTCVIIMLSNQHLDMTHLWGGWLSHSLTQIYTDLWTIFERNSPFVYIEKALDLWVQLMKNGGKTKVLRL